MRGTLCNDDSIPSFRRTLAVSRPRVVRSVFFRVMLVRAVFFGAVFFSAVFISAMGVRAMIFGAVLFRAPVPTCLCQLL